MISKRENIFVLRDLKMPSGCAQTQQQATVRVWAVNPAMQPRLVGLFAFFAILWFLIFLVRRRRFS